MARRIFLLQLINFIVDEFRNIMFIKLKTTGENPYYDEISNIEIKYLNTDLDNTSYTEDKISKK